MSEPTIYACAGPDDCSVPCDLKMVALADYERLTREYAQLDEHDSQVNAENLYLGARVERLTRENEQLRARVPELTRRRKVQADEIERLTRLVKIREAEIDWHVDEDKRLTRELDHFKNSGIIEVAIRNPNVSSYMDHWEERATNAEAELERLTRELAVTNDCLGNWRAREKALLADFNAQGEAIERLRAALERIARWNEHFEYAFSQDIMEFARAALGEPKP